MEKNDTLHLFMRFIFMYQLHTLYCKLSFKLKFTREKENFCEKGKNHIYLYHFLFKTFADP